MRCSHVRKNLLELGAGALPQPRAWRLRAHLRRCPACADARRELQRLETALRMAPADATPMVTAEESWRQVQRRLAAGRPRPALPSRPVVFTAAPLAAAVTVALLLVQPRPKTPPTVLSVTRAHASTALLHASRLDDVPHAEAPATAAPSAVATPNLDQRLEDDHAVAAATPLHPADAVIAEATPMLPAAPTVSRPEPSTPTPKPRLATPVVTIGYVPSPGVWRETSYCDGVAVTVECPAEEARRRAAAPTAVAPAPVTARTVPPEHLSPQPGVVRNAMLWDGSVESDPFLFAATVISAPPPAEARADETPAIVAPPSPTAPLEGAKTSAFADPTDSPEEC